MVEDVQLKTYTGHCRCGDVTFRAKGLSDIWYCHCTQCQHLTGHFVAAAAVPKDDFSYDGEVVWSDISANSKVGHCAACHSYLFWNNQSRPTISILVGNVDDTTGLTEKGHIFVADKKPYFEIKDGLPQFDQFPPQECRETHE